MVDCISTDDINVDIEIDEISAEILEEQVSGAIENTNISAEIIEESITPEVKESENIIINIGGDYRGPCEYGKLYVRCDSSATVGDLVYISGETAINATNNGTISPVTGVLIRYEDDGKAVVQVHGPCSFDFTGIGIGHVFVGEDGKPTNTKPTGGYLQLIGECFNAGKIYVSPVYQRVKQSPF